MLSSRRIHRLLGAGAVLLGLTGVTLVGVAACGQEANVPATHSFDAAASPTDPAASPSPSAGSASPTPRASTRTAPTPSRRASRRAGTKPAAPVLAESVPTRIRIPSIGVDASFVALRNDSSGAMETPKNPAQVGWYTGGHTPGAPGVAIVAGHVTYNDPAVFFKLGTLNAGDRITVTREDHSTATFGVRRIATFPKDRFPSALVYAPSDRTEMRLITCGGTYDSVHHRYLSNTIVWADVVGSSAHS